MKRTSGDFARTRKRMGMIAGEVRRARVRRCYKGWLSVAFAAAG
jgi:hypothetical protein